MIEARAAEIGAPLLLHGRDWGVWPTATGLRVEASGRRLELPRPALAGTHQIDNAGLAVAAALQLDEAELDDRGDRPRPARRRAGRHACSGWWRGRWSEPSRPDTTVWLDGGHNPAAGQVLADSLPGLLQRPGAASRGRHALDQGSGTVPGTSAAAGGEHALRARSRRGLEPTIQRPRPRPRGYWVRGPLRRVPSRPRCEAIVADEAAPYDILICGSLYLAGEVLRDNR